MDKIKKFILTRGLGYFFSVPALLFAILGMVYYCDNGVTMFNVDLSTASVVAFALGIAVCVIGFIIDFKPIKFLSSLFLLFAFADCISYQGNYIVNVLVGIDGNSFTSEFILTAVFSGLAWLFQLLASALDGIRIFKIKKEDGQQNEAQDEPCAEEAV